MINLSSKGKSPEERGSKKMSQDINDFFERFSSDFVPDFSSSRIWPKIDLLETSEQFETYVELPGIREEDLSVTLKDNNLVIRGEKIALPHAQGSTEIRTEISTGPFYRMIPFNSDVDSENVSASYKDGILIVTLKKLPETQRKIKNISVQMGHSASDELGARH